MDVYLTTIKAMLECFGTNFIYVSDIQWGIENK